VRTIAISSTCEGNSAGNLLTAFNGSEQEFDKRAISYGSPENQEFGIDDGHALSLEAQVAPVLVASSAPWQSLDVAV
jgi:hypothetical protein